MWGRANVGILALWLGRGRVNIALGEKEEPQIWRFGWSVGEDFEPIHGQFLFAQKEEHSQI